MFRWVQHAGGDRVLKELVALASQRLRLLDALFRSGGRLSISIGVVELAQAQAVPDWIAEADAALYRANHSGRNRVADSRRSFPART